MCIHTYMYILIYMYIYIYTYTYIYIHIRIYAGAVGMVVANSDRETFGMSYTGIHSQKSALTKIST